MKPLLNAPKMIRNIPAGSLKEKATETIEHTVMM